MAARRNDPDTDPPHTADMVELRAVPNHLDEQSHDDDAEAALLAHVLQRPAALHAVHQLLTPADFYRHDHQTLWSIIASLHAAGTTVDSVTVNDALRRSGHVTQQRRLDIVALKLLDTWPAGDPAYYAKILIEHTRRRATLTLATRLSQAAASPGSDIDTAAARALDQLIQVNEHRDGGTRPIPPTIRQILDSPDPPYDWLVPDFLERQDRLILTAGEGHGKSTLLRQWAVQLAAGIHPFTYEPIPPITVLHLDLENTIRQNRREYRRLVIAAGTNLDPARLRLEHRIDGIDLTDPDGVHWLDQLIAAVRPDLLVVGPIYKLANGDPTEEKSAKPVAMAIDRIRSDYGVTVLMEAHSSKPLGGAKKRAHEPYGWSGWLRWPEFGLWLDQDGGISPWRGARDATRPIPALLKRGGLWPWTVEADESELRLQRILAVIREVGELPSTRDLEDATGIPRSTVDRLLKQHDPRIRAVLTELESEAE